MYIYITYRIMKDDQDTNVSFVQAIETYPWLYDHSRAEYSNTDSQQDKAWTEKGTRFNAARES